MVNLIDYLQPFSFIVYMKRKYMMICMMISGPR